jgi:ssDNA-binding Zn-finger/Zn-ribbon topoisomerase 1
MPQSHMTDPPEKIEQPPCSKCGGPMWLARIEPTEKPDFDLRTFECPQCDQSDTVMVKYK